MAYDALGQMAERGIIGKNRAEIAAHILNDRIWDNQDKIKANGISIGTSNLSEDS